MKKSISKRIRTTKNGKVMHRKMALCHFRSKKNANAIRRKRLLMVGNKALTKAVFKKPGTL